MKREEFLTNILGLASMTTILYILGMQEKNEQAAIFNDVAVAGALTMTSVRIG